MVLHFLMQWIIKNGQSFCKFILEFYPYALKMTRQLPNLISSFDLSIILIFQKLAKTEMYWKSLIRYLFFPSLFIWIDFIIKKLSKYKYGFIIKMHTHHCLFSSHTLCHGLFSTPPTHRLSITTPSATPISLSICHNSFRAPNS